MAYSRLYDIVGVCCKSLSFRALNRNGCKLGTCNRFIFLAKQKRTLKILLVSHKKI